MPIWALRMVRALHRQKLLTPERRVDNRRTISGAAYRLGQGRWLAGCAGATGPACERLNCYNRRNKAGPLATGLSALNEGRAAGARPRMVRMRGLEPPRLAAPEPKSGASTSSATSA